jgi:hypothetical protein
VAAAGAAAVQGSGSQADADVAELDVVKARLQALKQVIFGEMSETSAEQQAKYQGRIYQMEENLKFLELQRVSARALPRL